MTNTLRKRFVIFTMSAVTLLLIFIVAAINSLNLLMLDRQSDAVMDTLVESEGHFQKMHFKPHPPFSPPLNMDKMHASRFFIVSGDLSGNILEVDTSKISSINPDTAEKYALLVVASGKTSGKIEGYKFAVKEIDDKKLFFFMDNSRQTETFLNVLFASIFIAILCWLILLIIVIALSGKVIRPVLLGMEKQKQFITNAGHEMKTPLAIIQSNNDTMALIHGENKYNTNISIQINRLNDLMSNMLFLAKLDENIPLPKESVNVSQLTIDLVSVYQESAKNNLFTFEVHIEPELIILTNKNSFSQLLTVLLDNAFKYTPADGRIYFSLTKQGKYLQIVEENTCNTSLEADPERFFERFYRGDSARTQNKSCGYGIGLSAARAICENFGGKLTAKYLTKDSIRFTAQILSK